MAVTSMTISPVLANGEGLVDELLDLYKVSVLGFGERSTRRRLLVLVFLLRCFQRLILGQFNDELQLYIVDRLSF